MAPPQTQATTTFTVVDLTQIGKQLSYPLLPYYPQLQQQTPAQDQALPIPPPPPTLDEGPHKGYALQWFSFASIAGFGFLLLVVREVLDERRVPTVPGAPQEGSNKMPRKGSARRPDGHLLVGFTLRAQILGHATEPFPQPARHAGS